jgi:uncharacterized protein (DUF2062 family)
LAGWFYRKFIVRLLELDDTPREIAWGIAIGVFVAMTPTVGIQMITIALLCTLFGGNRLAGVAMAWISNPLTVVPIYWLNYVIGSIILRTPPMTKAEIAQLVKLESTGMFGMFFEFLGNLGSMTARCAGPMFLGGVIVGIVCAIPSYYIFLPLFTKWKAAFKKEKELETAKAAESAPSEQAQVTRGERPDGGNSKA